MQIVKRWLDGKMIRWQVLNFFLSTYLSIHLSTCLYGENKLITKNFKWKVVETYHFYIYYYPEEISLVERVSKILEGAYERITKDLDFKPHKKIPFFLYLNHNEFEQTNIVDIGEGTGGVTEAFKYRFLIFHNGSEKWLKNVILHELTHVIQFYVLFDDAFLLRPFRLSKFLIYPLWFMEGLAEYSTGDLDATEREMIVKDLATTDKLIPLSKLHGFNHLKPHQVTPGYKLGNSVVNFIAEEYGRDKIGEILKTLRDKFDSSSAFSDVINIGIGTLDRKWQEYLKERYTVEIEGKKEADDYGKKLTKNEDKIPDFNTDATISVDGRIAFISDRNGWPEVFIMDSAGKSQKKLVTRSRKVEYIHPDSLGFSKDGKKLIFTGEKKQRDYVYIKKVKGGLKKIKIKGIESLKSPIFSADDKNIFFCGMEKGVFNIYVADLNGKNLKKLTDTPNDKSDIKISPDGKYLVYSKEDGTQRDLCLLELDSGQERMLTNFEGDETEPSFSPDGKRIIFIADEKRGGTGNAYIINSDGTEIKKITDITCGLFTPSFSSDGKKILFASYREQNKDIYIGDIENFGIPQVIEKKEIVKTEELTPPVTSYIQTKARAYGFKFSSDILIPFAAYSTSDGWFVATVWQGSELLGNHELTAGILYRSKPSAVDYQVGYSYKRFRPQFFISSMETSFEYITTTRGIVKKSENGHFFGIHYPLNRYHRLEFGLFTTGEFEEASSGKFYQRTNRFSVAFDRDTVNGKWLYATSGSRLRLVYQKASKVLSGNLEYNNYIGEINKFLTFYLDTVIALRVIGGLSFGPDKENFTLPTRGYADSMFESPYVVSTTVELRIPIFRDINYYMSWLFPDFYFRTFQIYLFTDNGLSFKDLNQFEKIKTSDIRNSFGAGFHLYTFIMQRFLLPLNFEYARKTNPDGDEWNFRLGIMF